MTPNNEESNRKGSPTVMETGIMLWFVAPPHG